MLVTLVLLEDIPKMEKEGWQRFNDRVHVFLGGWPSVYMVKGGSH